jgi:ABC-type branched-subunit amino acid transport system permease subunit
MNLVANKRHLLISALVLLLLPLGLQAMGNFWVRIADFALLYVLLALGLNIVVGFAGLLDLGFVAFFAIGGHVDDITGIGQRLLEKALQILVILDQQNAHEIL